MADRVNAYIYILGEIYVLGKIVPSNAHKYMLSALYALIFDAILGDPAPLWRRISHPVVIMGRIIEKGDRRLNRAAYSRQRRRVNGALFVYGLALAIFCAMAVMVNILEKLPYSPVFIGFFASIFLAQNSLYRHVNAVAQALCSHGNDTARQNLGKIVGRDTKNLNESDMCRASIESLAENFSDGVVAPLFWLIIAGLPGIVTYKFINTADSMIGYKREEYIDFGAAAARLDDVVNWPAARLSGLILALAALFARRAPCAAIAAMWRDAGKHASPNAGWPEAAMAGALQIALGGPRQYPGQAPLPAPFLNQAGRKKLTFHDIFSALIIYIFACAILFFCMLFASMFEIIISL